MNIPAGFDVCARVCMVCTWALLLGGCVWGETVATGPADSAESTVVVTPAASGESDAADEGEIARVPVAPAEQYNSDDVAWIQRRLRDQGYYNGNIDGSVGLDTRDAIREYQFDQGMEPDGRPTTEFRKFMWRNGG